MSGSWPEVEAELQEQGFVADGAEGYVGRLAGVAVRLHLPPAFPFTMPKISVEEPAFPVPFPHVEERGAVCLGPSEGVLLDAGRPAAIVNEALGRASRILQAKDRGVTAADYADELPAYWKPRDKSRVWSLVPPGGPTRAVSLVEAGSLSVIGESEDEAVAFMQRIARTDGSRRRAWWFSLDRPIEPPAEALTVGSLDRLIRANISDAGRRTVKAWDDQEPPRTWLLSCPDSSGQPRWVLGARIPLTPRRINGFTAPTLRALRTALAPAPVSRLDVSQIGPDYLLRRGGANVDLLGATAVVIGAGAIGGYLVGSIASLGVGTIHIVDPDALSPDNMYRHVLGFHGVSQMKVNALREVVREQFPHLRVEAHAVDAQAFLDTQQEVVSKAGVIISATGAPSANMAISDRLREHLTPRIYVWLEAHGIGGHVFVEARRGPGCYRCLYDAHAEHGLVDLTSFYAPGQNFTTSMPGCTSTFTPFGALDAQRAAIECGRVVQRVLRHGATGPMHLRWREELPEGITASLSAAAMSIGPGQRHEVGPADRRWGCSVCDT